MVLAGRVGAAVLVVYARCFCAQATYRLHILKLPLSGRLWASILGSWFFVAYSHLCKVSSYCGGVLTFTFDTPYYRDTLLGGCINTPLLRNRPPHSYPPKGGMTIWHLPPPERGYPPKRGGCQIGIHFFYDLFREVSETVLLENFFVHFF